jgi:hypothetical protein
MIAEIAIHDNYKRVELLLVFDFCDWIRGIFIIALCVLRDFVIMGFIALVQKIIAARSVFSHRFLQSEELFSELLTEAVHSIAFTTYF